MRARKKRQRIAIKQLQGERWKVERKQKERCIAVVKSQVDAQKLILLHARVYCELNVAKQKTIRSSLLIHVTVSSCQIVKREADSDRDTCEPSCSNARSCNFVKCVGNAIVPEIAVIF